MLYLDRGKLPRVAVSRQFVSASHRGRMFEQQQFALERALCFDYKGSFRMYERIFSHASKSPVDKHVDMGYEKSHNHRSSSISTEDENSYWVKGVKMFLPETKVPTIAVNVPEMKNDISYWQIGTASVSRVKINALDPNVEIITEEAGKIVGMFSEGYAPIATLGTAIIHIRDIPIEVHVTRSANVAPVVADGILGYDFFEVASACLNLSSKTLSIAGRGSPVPMLQGKELIPDYLKLLRQRMIASSIEIEKGAWSVVSEQLARLREFLPQKIISQEGAAPIIEILEEYVDCFHLPGDKLSFTEELIYSIKTNDDKIITCIPQYELSIEDQNEIERQVSVLLDQEIIVPSTSPYNSPMRLIERKSDSQGHANYLMAGEFKELNKRSSSDPFPVPDIIDLVDQLHGSVYFTVLDLASAAYQINLKPEDRKKTAFTTRSGRYEFQRMPHGIRNASQTIQRLMCNVLNDMLAANMVFVCHDDILIHAASIEEHEIRVRRVLSLIRKAGLKLQPKKCHLFETCVPYLGYLVGYEGLRPDPAKIERLLAEELPIEPRALERYLGLLSNYKRFVQNFTSKCAPMYDLLKDKTTIEWTEEAIDSFNDLRNYLSNDLLLQYPDWSKPFILETSPSLYGFQAALLQEQATNVDAPWSNRRALPIAYASRNYTANEWNYDKYGKEYAATIYGMVTWYWYFNDSDSKEFVLRTNEPKIFNDTRQKPDSDIHGYFKLRFNGQQVFIESSLPKKYD